MKDNVSIVGGATSGLVAARQLAGLGIATSVYDQKHVLGIPIKASGILSIDGLNTLGIDYQKGITNTLYGARMHANNSVMRIDAKRPMAYVLDRKELNAICKDEAEKSGAKVILGSRIDGTKLDALSKSSIIVGADGAVSTVAKHFGMGAIGRYALTFKAEYNVDLSDTRMVDVFFDRKITPGFFGWLCPNAKDILEVGIGIQSKYGNSKSAFEKFIKTKEISKLIEGSKMISGEASMIPLELRKQIVDSKREIMLVGDAAGQVKPTTGGGIIFGCNAAKIAAKVISGHIKEGQDLGDYKKLFYKGYNLDLKLHSFVNKFYSGVSNRGMGYTLSIMNAVGFDGFLGKYGDMDRPSKIVKRAFLRGLAE